MNSMKVVSNYLLVTQGSQNNIIYLYFFGGNVYLYNFIPWEIQDTSITTPKKKSLQHET